MLLVLLLILLSWATYFLVIKPLVPLIKIKLQFGAEASLDYYPFIGDSHRFKKNQKKFNDPFYHLRHFNANVQTYKKFRLTNLMDQPLIGINDPEYYKQVFVDHHNYEKFDVIGHEYYFCLYTLASSYRMVYSSRMGKSGKNKEILSAIHSIMKCLNPEFP